MGGKTVVCNGNNNNKIGNKCNRNFDPIPTLLFSYLINRCLLKESKNMLPQKNLHHYVYGIFIHKMKMKQPKYPPTGECIKNIVESP